MNDGRRRKTNVGSKLEGRKKKRKVVASIILRQIDVHQYAYQS